MQMLTPLRQTNRLTEQEDSACKCFCVAFDVQVCVCVCAHVAVCVCVCVGVIRVYDVVFVSAIAGVVCLAAV